MSIYYEWYDSLKLHVQTKIMKNSAGLSVVQPLYV